MRPILPDLPCFKPGGSLDRIGALRRKHLERGHTLENDCDKPLLQLQLALNHYTARMMKKCGEDRIRAAECAAAILLAIADREQALLARAAAAAADDAAEPAPIATDLFDT